LFFSIPPLGAKYILHYLAIVALAEPPLWK
jgi:hypothetical protein